MNILEGRMQNSRQIHCTELVLLRSMLSNMRVTCNKNAWWILWIVAAAATHTVRLPLGGTEFTSSFCRNVISFYTTPLIELLAAYCWLAMWCTYEFAMRRKFFMVIHCKQLCSEGYKNSKKEWILSFLGKTKLYFNTLTMD